MIRHILFGIFTLLALPSTAQTHQVLLETTEGNIRIALSDLTPIPAWHQARHAEPGAMLGEGDVGYTLEPEFRTPQLFHRRGVIAMAREGDDVNPSRKSSGCQFYIVWGKTLATKDLENMQVRLDSMTNHQVKITPEMFQTYRRIGGTPHLDGQYTVFGEVVEGMDVVNRIQQVFTDDYDRPVDDVRIIRAICFEAKSLQ